ncbi:MAG: porphobilinogen synthase, partial [Micromonosporaceae bacterium]
MAYPDSRPRRLRHSAALRRLVEETRPAPGELVLPMFIREGLTEPRPVTSLPGVLQHTRESLRKAAAEAVSAGVGGLMLFGVPDRRDPVGSGATDPDGILNVAIRDVISEVGDSTVVMGDLCLDEFTSHGHCGVLADDGSVDNDATLVRYADMALAQAAAGVHAIGLSGMMDGQVGACRRALDAAGHPDVVILAYAAKYASA